MKTTNSYHSTTVERNPTSPSLSSKKRTRWLFAIVTVACVTLALVSWDPKKAETIRREFLGDDSAAKDASTLTAQEKRALALKFAPNLYFDNAMDQFPMNAQHYLEPSKWQNKPLLFQSSNNEVWNGNIRDSVTYFFVLTCGSQVRIIYTWFYGYQPSCVTALSQSSAVSICQLLTKTLTFLKVDNCGYHRGDWERVMVTLSLDRKKMAAVTYWAHGDEMTVTSKFIPVAPNGRLIAWVGKLGHGSYPDGEQRGGIPGVKESCNFFADWRNNDGDRTRWDVASAPNQLFMIDKTNPPAGQSWMADPKFCNQIPNNGKVTKCDIGSKPQETNPNDFCNVQMCKKSDACSVSYCLSYQDRSGMQCTSWMDGSKTSIEQKIPTTNYGLLPTVPADGTMFKCTHNNRVYFQMNGKKRYIVDHNVMTRIWGSDGQKHISLQASQTYCDRIPTGEDLGAHTKLVKCNGNTFLQTSVTKKSWICDSASYTAFGFLTTATELSTSDCQKTCNAHWLCLGSSQAGAASTRITIDQTFSCPTRLILVPSVVHQRDRGSDADQDLVIWKANIPASEAACVPIATVATNGNAGGSVPCLFGSENVDYAKPSKYSKVWVDWGSGNHNDYSLWRPVCPSGFVTLSDTPHLDIYGGNHAKDLPFQGVYCVAAKYAVGSSVGHRLWSDKGTGASQDGSVWLINGGYWAASPNHGHPTVPVYRLTLGVSRTITCSQFDGYDTISNDIKNEQRSSMTDCQMWCSQTSNCWGYTFVKGSNWCYLKTGVNKGFFAKANNVAGACSQSACPKNDRWDGKNVRGHDVASNIPAYTFDQCKAICRTHGCKYFTRNKSTNKCYLKNGSGGLEDNAVDESGSCYH